MSKRHHRPRRHLTPVVADEALTAASFAEAALLALEMPAAVGACEEVFVFVAGDGHVVRMVIDPANPGSARIWTPRRRVPERGDERVLYVAVKPKVEMAPPPDDAV